MAGLEIRNQAIGLQLENSSADLTPTSTGLVYFNTTSSIAKIYTGASWKTFLFADLSNVTGTLAIANGGTGQTSQTNAFDALAPTTTAGDTIYHNGTDNIRLAIGTSGQVLTSNGTAPAWSDAGSGGSGEINVITNPSASSATTGWSAGTNHTVTRLTSGSPLDPTIATAFRFAKTVASATTESSTSGDYSAFTLPTGLENTKLKVQFYCIVPATGVWRVSVYDGTTRLSLSTDSSSVTTLSAGFTGKFTTTFDTTANNTYTVSFTETSGVICNLDATSIIVGPGIQPQGAVVDVWQSYTYSVSNLGTGTPTTGTGYYRRVGSEMEIRLGWTATAGGTGSSVVAWSIPSGYTIDSSKLPGGYDSFSSVAGLASTFGVAGVSNADEALTVYVKSSTTVGVVKPGASDGLIATDFTTGDLVGLKISVPISEWAGSGTVNLAENNVEYSWSAETGTTANTAYTSTANYRYGSQGVQFNSIAASASAGDRTTYQVGFQTPIQPTDKITLEVSDDSGTTWTEAGVTDLGVENLLAVNTYYYGLGIQKVNSTAVKVVFGNRGRSLYGAATYSAAGNAWSDIAASTSRWRVKKASGGQSVGFGEVAQNSSGLVKSAGQLKGTNTNDTAAAGYVGEYIESLLTGAGSTPTSSQHYDLTASPITLTAGDWDISGIVTFDSNGGTYTQCRLGIGTVTGNSSTGLVPGQNQADLSVPTSVTQISLTIPSYRVSISATTSYYLKGLIVIASGSPRASGARISARRVR